MFWVYTQETSTNNIKAKTIQIVEKQQHKFSMEIEFYFNGDTKIILVCVYRFNVFFVFLGSFWRFPT